MVASRVKISCLLAPFSFHPSLSPSPTDRFYSLKKKLEDSKQPCQCADAPNHPPEQTGLHLLNPPRQALFHRFHFRSELLLGMIEVPLRCNLLVGIDEEIDNRIGLILWNAPLLEALRGLAGVFEKWHGTIWL